MDSGVVGDTGLVACNLGDVVVVGLAHVCLLEVDVAKDHVSIGVVGGCRTGGHGGVGLARLQREGKLVGLEVATLKHLGSAQGIIAGEGLVLHAIGVGEDGRAARCGGHGAIAVVDNGDHHELARGRFGVVGHAVNTAGLGDAVVVDAGLGEGDVVKAGRGAIAVHAGHRGAFRHGRVGGLGRERKGVLTGDVTGTSKTAGYGKVLGDLDRSGCGCGAIAVGEGKVRALHGVVVLVDCLGDQVAALVGHLDLDGLGGSVVGHAVNGTGLSDGVGVLTRRGVGDLIERNGAAGVVRGSVDHLARGVLELERELVLDVSGARETVGFEHLAARDHKARVVCIVDVLERQARGVAGILNLSAKRAVAAIGNHNSNLEGVLHGGHLGRQMRGVLGDRVTVDVGVGSRANLCHAALNVLFDLVDGVVQRAKVQRCGLAVAGSGILCRSNNIALGVRDVERKLVGIHVTPAEGLGCADGRSTRSGVGVAERDCLAGAVLDGPRHLEGVGVGVGRHRCHQCVGGRVIGVAVSTGVSLGQSVLVGANLAKRNVAKAHRAVCRIGRRCRSRRRCIAKRRERERELLGRQLGGAEGLVDGDVAITGRAGLNRRELVGVGHGVLGVALVHAARDGVSGDGASAACGHGREGPASRRGLLVNRIRGANGKVLEEDALPCREGKGRGLTACKRTRGVTDGIGDVRAIRSGHGDVKVEAGVRGVYATIRRDDLCNLELALEGVGSGYGSGPVIGVVGHAIHHHGGEGLVAQLVAGVDGRLGEGHLATGSKHLTVDLDAVRYVYLGLVAVVGVERHRGEGLAIKEHAERDITGGSYGSIVKRVDPFLAHGDGGSVHGHGVGVGKGHAASIGFSRYIQTRGLLGIGKAGGG